MKPNPSHRRNYLVWSNKHGCWWRSNEAGYTNEVANAGQYTKKEATAIADDSAYASTAVPFKDVVDKAVAEIAIHQRAITKLRRIVELPVDVQAIES